MSDKKIKYLPHPVTPEEKRKWTDKGFKIIDKVFEPEKGSKVADKPDEKPDDQDEGTPE